jgi:hypothetical protein
MRDKNIVTELMPNTIYMIYFCNKWMCAMNGFNFSSTNENITHVMLLFQQISLICFQNHRQKALDLIIRRERKNLFRIILNIFLIFSLKQNTFQNFFEM